jgi:hypothetical protein
MQEPTVIFDELHNAEIGMPTDKEGQKTDKQVVDEMMKQGWIPSDHVRSPITNCPKCHEPVISRSLSTFGRKSVQLGNSKVEDTKTVEKVENLRFSYGTAKTVMTFHKLLSYPQPGDVFHPDVCPKSRANRLAIKEKNHGRQQARS